MRPYAKVSNWVRVFGMGLELTMMKLLNQFEHVERATPFARREEGKISKVERSCC